MTNSDDEAVRINCTRAWIARKPESKPRIPTLTEFLEGLEAESDEGRRRTISKEEAIKRYEKMYPATKHQNGEG